MEKMSELICVKCKEKINYSDESITCASCQTTYKVVDGIPILMMLDQGDFFKQIERDFHTKIATAVDDAHALSSMRVKYLHEKFLSPIRALPTDSLILDVACGTGVDLLHLCKEGYILRGIDISLGMCKVANTKIRQNNYMDRAKIVEADAELLPFGPDTFDAAYISGALHHSRDPKKVLQEMHRVVKGDGLVVIGSEPNRWPYRFRKLKYSSLGKRILRFFRDDYTIEGGSIADYETEGFSKKDFIQVANENGFLILDFQPIWYISGFLSLFKLKLPQRVESATIFIDDIISRIPGIKNYSWKWNIIYRVKKPNSGAGSWEI